MSCLVNHSLNDRSNSDISKKEIIMKQINYAVLCLKNALVMLSLCVLFNQGFAGVNANNETVAPLRLDRDLISGVELEEVPWFDDSVKAKWNFLFTGKELSVSVFESTPKNDSEHEYKKNKRTISSIPLEASQKYYAVFLKISTTALPQHLSSALF
jgi:hypothetical protein